MSDIHPVSQVDKQAQRLFLIGYRGCGKSTIGRLIAQLLDRPFVDTDDEIEEQAGCTIAQIFAEQGETGFRDLEQRILKQQIEQVQTGVFSLGGGIILRRENQQVITDGGHCVWLSADPKVLFQRIVGDQASASRRPNLSGMGGFNEVVEMLEQRKPIYAQLADLTVDTGLRGPDEVAREIADWVTSRE